MSPFVSEGTLKTDKREVAISETWDTDSDWNAAQSMNSVVVENGVVKLEEGAGDPPDTADLHSWYDFSEEDGSMPVTDQTGNGEDLDSGGYDGVGVAINGVQAGEFSTNTTVNSTSLTSISPPFHVFYVIEPTDTLDGDYLMHTDKHPSVRNISGSDTWAVRPSGSDANVAGNGQNPVVIEVLYDSSDTTVWINETGATDTIGDAASSRSVYYLGGRSGQGFFTGNVGEVLRYDVSKETNRSDVHTYLSDKWGPF